MPGPAPIAAVRWDGRAVVLVDQTRLPHEEVELRCTTVAELADAIRRLVVRGAPALGLAGAYGMALAAATGADLGEAAALLAGTRPTAVNLGDAVHRAHLAALATPDGPLEAALAAADALSAEDAAAASAMAVLGAALLPEGARVLTHCNTGALVSAGCGTAFGVVAEAYRTGRLAHLWVDETRPLLQGARLTTWEAARLGIPHTLLADNAAGSLLAAGAVDAVLVGADRVCADGTVANKVGTYPLAVLARVHDVPFYVVAPTTTVDPSAVDGSAVEIEQRDASEVTSYAGQAVAPPGTPAYNPAFDLTPARLVTALVTERGVLAPVTADALGRLRRPVAVTSDGSTGAGPQ